ncbi:MAG: Bug family tripartite tricarboxylate transporter substrate binding protein [Burkholderiales bacterium]
MFVRATIVALTGIFLSQPPAVLAQAYPVRPLRMVVPFSPGGGSDLLGRAIASELSVALGQQVIVENRGGAQGSVGAVAVAKSRPDGYTVLLSFVGILAMNPWLYKDTGFDPVRDFTHISYAAVQPPLVVVNPRVPVKNLKELAMLGRTKEGLLNFAAGSSSGQLAGELFNLLAGIKMTHVPYKGGGPAIVDIVAGNVDVMLGSPTTTIPMVRAGKLRAIAIAGPTRISSLPDVPTSKESGFPDFDVNGWYAVSAPANMPADIVAKLNAEIARALGSSTVKNRLVTEGYEPKSSSPEEITAHVKAEYERWGKVVKAAGIGQQ